MMAVVAMMIYGHDCCGDGEDEGGEVTLLVRDLMAVYTTELLLTLIRSPHSDLL